MSGLAGQSIGLEDQSPTPIGGAAAIDAESKGSMENFIGFGIGATNYDPAPVDFDSADDTITAASDGSTRISPEYTGNQLTWGGYVPPVPVFSPTDLFLNGEQGIWADFSDLTVMFQDEAGTIPVVGIGDPVVLVKDKSGNGNDLIFQNATLESVNGIFGVRVLGINNSIGQTQPLALGDKLTVWAAYHSDSASNNGDVVGTGNITTTPGVFSLQGIGTLYRRGDGAWGGRDIVVPTTTTQLLTAVLDLAGTTQDTENPLLTLNASQLTMANYGQADTGGGDFATLPIKVGYAFEVFAGTVFEVIVRNTISTQDEIAACDIYVGEKIGVEILAPHGTITQFQDTGTIVDKIDYLQTSAYAHADFTTTATKLEITGYSNIASVFPTYADLGIFISGAFNQEVSASVNGSFTVIATLPAGAKTISVENGLQSSPTNNLNTIVGTFLNSLKSNAPLTQVFPAPVDRMVIYGDSIAVGGNSITPLVEGWGSLVRKARVGKSTAFEAFGYRNLFLDCATAPLRADFVAKIQAYNPSKLWMAIGTNDFGMTTINANGFGTMYGDTLDAIHAAMPSLDIYCQTMILRTPTDAQNGNALVIQDYRDSMTAAIVARPWATLVDGLPFVSAEQLDDGTHPTTAGHASYASAVKAILGVA
jgi:lysophospholipase L1-like esterase